MMEHTPQMTAQSGLAFAVAVVDVGKGEKILSLFREEHALLDYVCMAHGTARTEMLDLLGIESNERRVVLTIADAEKTAALIAAQKRRLHIGVPGHGIVIAVPIKSVGGGNTVAYLNGGRSPKYTPALSCAYELIIAIANEGGTDAVMNAARAAGARGGTVLHGKGTGAKGAPKFYNISIAAEKEVILIVSAAGQKAEIMRSILRKAGPDSDAGAIVFSLPASAVAGFGLLEEN